MRDKTINSNGNNEIYKPIIKGLIFGTIVTVIILLTMAFVLTLHDFSPSIAAPMSSIAVAIGAFIAGFTAAKSYRRRGLLLGLVTGFLLFMIVTLIALAVNRNGFSVQTLMRFAIIIISSIIGGILGVNTRNETKIV